MIPYGILAGRREKCGLWIVDSFAFLLGWAGVHLYPVPREFAKLTLHFFRRAEQLSFSPVSKRGLSGINARIVPGNSPEIPNNK